jgi:hypothetical protein
MKFSLVDEIPHPRALVFATHRDRLVDVVKYMPNVAGVVTESRIEEGDLVHLVNRWTGASTEIPAPLRPLVKPELLTWVDRATWDQARWKTQWSITLDAVADAISAHGENTFLDEGPDTVVQMNGEFVVHPERIRGVPSFVARSAAPALERFVVGLLQPNLKRSNAAVRQYLDDNA